MYCGERIAMVIINTTIAAAVLHIYKFLRTIMIKTVIERLNTFFSENRVFLKIMKQNLVSFETIPNIAKQSENV